MKDGVKRYGGYISQSTIYWYLELRFEKPNILPKKKQKKKKVKINKRKEKRKKKEKKIKNKKFLTSKSHRGKGIVKSKFQRSRTPFLSPKNAFNPSLTPPHRTHDPLSPLSPPRAKKPHQPQPSPQPLTYISPPYPTRNSNKPLPPRPRPRPRRHPPLPPPRPRRRRRRRPSQPIRNQKLLRRYERGRGVAVQIDPVARVRLDVGFKGARGREGGCHLGGDGRGSRRGRAVAAAEDEVLACVW